MLYDWNTYRDELHRTVGDFARLNPPVMRGLSTLDAFDALPAA